MNRSGETYSSGRRIAKNAIFLYLRMFVLMLVGLYTSRVVLKSLGIDDYGVWNLVGGVVTFFTFITTAVSNAISRFLTVELGRGDMKRLRSAFTASRIVQIALSLLLIILVESIGQWSLGSWLDIPTGRLSTARTVLHCSLAILVINMLAVPYNAAIIAHERMSAFALISILEGLLKLALALLISTCSGDKLEFYAVLMFLVAALVRSAYGIYCRRNFPECRLPETGKEGDAAEGRKPDLAILREMLSFAGWSFLGSGAYVINTQGVTMLLNVFFGVALNAARGVVLQVETIVKQFVTNFMTALNPQITKSWASGDAVRSHTLVREGMKFAFLVILIFALPLCAEAELLLGWWLVEVPPYAPELLRVMLVALLIDMTANPLLTLQLATGRVKTYYLQTGVCALLGLPAAWLIFRSGGSPLWAYGTLAIVYAAVFAIRLRNAGSDAGFPAKRFLSADLPKLLALALLSSAIPVALCIFAPDGWLRLLLVCVSGWAVMAVCAFTFVLTPSEKAFLLRKPQPCMPDRLYLELYYYRTFGRVPDLKNPRRYTEQLQWQKLYDRNPLYHTLADKQDVKAWVAARIGEEHVIPTLGLWSTPKEINWDALPGAFVLKCTHDSGSVLICRDKSTFDRADAASRLNAALHRNFYSRMREWAYKGLRPRIIAEPYLEGGLNDYKFFCFHGQPQVMFVATERGVPGEEVKFDFFDMSYRHLDIRNGHPNAAVPPARPACFEEMKALAAQLSEGMPQVRVDFYEHGGRVLFGEFTFYHFGGFMSFDPDSADEWMGSFFKLPER